MGFCEYLGQHFPLAQSFLKKNKISNFFKSFPKSFYFKKKLFRDVVGSELLSNGGNAKIGGPGLTVEIDESMFGKRKVIRLKLVNYKK